jgi:hypothetical protein
MGEEMDGFLALRSSLEAQKGGSQRKLGNWRGDRSGCAAGETSSLRLNPPKAVEGAIAALSPKAFPGDESGQTTVEF